MTVSPASPPPYTYGVSEFTTMPWSVERDIETYARLGVEAMELCEVKLDADDGRAAAQIALAAHHGLTISSVQPAVRTLFPSASQQQPLDPGARMDLFLHTITRLAGIAPGTPFVTNTGIAPGGNIQEVVDAAARIYRTLSDKAAEHGMRVALEPLNATIMNVESAIWTVAQARRIVEAVDRPNFGVCLDSWNIWQNAGVEAEIRACGDRVFVVQLSDYRTPRAYDDRLAIGQGEIPLAGMLRAIYDTGFRGAYSLEIFSQHVSDALWEGDLEAVIRESRAGLDRAWQAAFEGARPGPVQE